MWRGSKIKLRVLMAAAALSSSCLAGYVVIRETSRSHCDALRVSYPVHTLGDLGTINFESFGRHKLWLSSSEGNLVDDRLYDRRTDNFNYDGLYRLTKDGKSWYFRHGGQTFNHDNTNRTFLYDVQWVDQHYPKKPGKYHVEVVGETKPVSLPTFNTVGDSITWWQHGEYLRCMLADAGIGHNFIGSRTDIFGYGHDGEGGDNTRDVLKRIKDIAPSSTYFLLIGTNDRFETRETVDNILKIARALSKKQPNTIVLVSTLLPRSDEFDQRNQKVNDALRQYFKSCTSCDSITLVDTHTAFIKQENWQGLLADGLHPSKAGYLFLAQFIKGQLHKQSDS
jgi:hypothetical protein